MIMMNFKQFRRKFQGMMYITNDMSMAVRIRKVLDFNPNDDYISVILEECYVLDSKFYVNGIKEWVLPKNFNGFTDAKQVSKHDYENFKRKWK